jgi:hypothetical protein
MKYVCEIMSSTSWHEPFYRNEQVNKALTLFKLSQILATEPAILTQFLLLLYVS